MNNGDKVSADIRMFESDACKVEMSSLTGEPIAIKRETAPEPNPNPLEAKNLAFFTTQILNGKGRGIVIRTWLIKLDPSTSHHAPSQFILRDKTLAMR